MGLRLPQQREEGGLFLRSDVRSTNAGGIVQSNFNTTDFDVIGGVVDLKNKTSYISIPGSSFRGTDAGDQAGLNYDAAGSVLGTLNSPSSGLDLTGAIQIPNNAVVTGAIVYGNGNRPWILNRKALSGGANTSMANANTDSEDTTISNATIDNSTYTYHFTVSGTTGLQIYGARITYTTDYD